MARIFGVLEIQIRGVEECMASLGSISEACNNAHLDFGVVELVGPCLMVNGLTITYLKTASDSSSLTLIITPTGGMILFVGWLMTKLPPHATVKWRAGWPIVQCRPNEEGDFEFDPSPLHPDELELV